MTLYLSVLGGIVAAMFVAVVIWSIVTDWRNL